MVEKFSKVVYNFMKRDAVYKWAEEQRRAFLVEGCSACRLFRFNRRRTDATETVCVCVCIYIYIYGCTVRKSFRVIAFALLHLTHTRAFSSTSYEVSVEMGVTHSNHVRFKCGDQNIIPLSINNQVFFVIETLCVYSEVGTSFYVGVLLRL
jgi:hypothetical protein